MPLTGLLKVDYECNHLKLVFVVIRETFPIRRQRADIKAVSAYANEFAVLGPAELKLAS